MPSDTSPTPSDERPDERPWFSDPFSTPPDVIASPDVVARTQAPFFAITDASTNLQLAVRVRGDTAPSVSSRHNAAPSIHSSNSIGRGGSLDLMTHRSSLFSSSRKQQSLTRQGSQVFRRPKPSTMLVDEIPKPWLKYKDPAHRWSKWIFWGCWVAALGIVVGLCYQAYAAVPSLGNLCAVMEDDFSTGSISRYNWDYQVDVDPGVLGTFQWNTASPNNSFVSGSTLYLVPTLTSDHLGTGAIINGATVNLTADGSCTDTNVTHCVVTSNSTLGTVINPVQGVKLRSKFSITYGKVEIVARLPTGDWIWPTLRMMPVDNKYGPWPRSGEIDILNARGNLPGYVTLGSDYMQSALHWGPNKLFDSYFRTWGIRRDKTNAYANGFRKYTLEWNDKYLTTYIDNKVQTVMMLTFDQSFWDRGNYPTFYTDENGNIAKLESPWYASDSKSAPFDQPFYLEMILAVGGTSAYFPDGVGNKPWQDSSPLASTDFWTAKDRWLPSWPVDKTKRGMAIKSVKMYKTC